MAKAKVKRQHYHIVYEFIECNLYIYLYYKCIYNYIFVYRIFNNILSTINIYYGTPYS